MKKCGVLVAFTSNFPPFGKRIKLFGLANSENCEMRKLLQIILMLLISADVFASENIAIQAARERYGFLQELAAELGARLPEFQSNEEAIKFGETADEAMIILMEAKIADLSVDIRKIFLSGDFRELFAPASQRKFLRLAVAEARHRLFGGARLSEVEIKAPIIGTRQLLFASLFTASLIATRCWSVPQNPD